MGTHSTVIAVGKLKEKFWVDAANEYIKRLSVYTKLTIIEVPDRDPASCGGELQARQREAKDILAAIPSGAHTILLDIFGRQQSSEGLSAHISELALAGSSEQCFIVGGSTGVDTSIKQRADEALSFGLITLPHNLARVVLLEQLYRAYKIARSEPYHK